MMNALKIVAQICVISFLFSFKVFSIEDKFAVKYVENLGQQAIEILKIPIEDIDSREKLFKKMLDTKFDKKLIHRAVLGRSAKNASKEQLIRFGKAFDEHIIKIYASQLGVYSDQLFVVDKVIKRDKKDTIVLSHIEHATAPPLRIDWRLRDRGKRGLKIIDIAIEGVSLLATKRADFSSTIKRGGLHGLIIDLEEKNTQNN
mgnify:CR=1 FL=1